MPDFRTHIDIVGAGFGGVAGTSIPKRPFPSLGGKLRAAYCFGYGYASFAPTDIGRHMGPWYDWSENSQHIRNVGRQRPGDWWLEGLVSTAMPATPFTGDALINADPSTGVTLVAFHYADASAKAISLIRSLDGITTANPYFSLTLQPQTSSGRVLALVSDGSTPLQGTLNPLPDELGVITMYAATFTSASRRPYAQAPGEAILSGTAQNTSQTLQSTGRFEFAVETGSGAGVNRLLAAAFYRGVLSTSELTDNIRADFATFHSAIGSGLTIT